MSHAPAMLAGMIEILLLVSANVFLLLTFFAVAQLARARRADGASWEKLRARLDEDDQRFERVLRDELRGTREETGSAFRGLREEVNHLLKGSGDSLAQQLDLVARRND